MYYTKEFLKFLLRLGLILGSIVALGFLSFSGIMLLHLPVYVAVGGFFLAAVIEGEVNKQNIDQALAKIFSKNSLELVIVERELALLLQDEKTVEQSQFLQDYKNLFEYVQELHHKKADEEEIKKAEERLCRLQ